ncbi:hypothetical protein [Cellulomonas sp. HZM]|uniref:hypothetical protein n=1 Tax=Cellulomonas sp. HZM TaxID=1454010 RepID=UPI0004939CEF|nr:hypothetical protein [Cellulomonas sp. HZM]
MSDRDTREYDAFGPWVDEVRSADDVPRLFRPFRLDLARTRLVLKVPRDIARRDATPDMDLYDHLVVLDDTRITVLTRIAAGGFDESAVAYGDVLAVVDAVDLLDARFTLHDRHGGTLSFRYNGSAGRSMKQLVSELRSATSDAPISPVARAVAAAPGGPPPGSDDLGPRGRGLVSEYLDVARSRPDLRAQAWHGPRTLQTRRTGPAAWWHRVVSLFLPTRLAGAVVASGPRTLELVTRREGITRSARPDYSLARVVVPLGALDRVDAAPHPELADVTVLTLVGGEGGVPLAVPTGSSTETFLTAT